jgi:hypothetical protein
VCRLASVVWMLRGGCHALPSVVVCVGVMDTCGRLKTGVGGGFMAGGVSKVRQRSCWGRQLSRHSGGCYWCTLHKCRIIL